jgi:hypothetical protein
MKAERSKLSCTLSPAPAGFSGCPGVLLNTHDEACEIKRLEEQRGIRL